MNLKRLGWLVPALLLGISAWAGAAYAGPAKVYVADEEGDTVTVLDATSFAKLAAIPVGREPHNVQVSPDGRWAWVTINYEIEPKGTDQEKHRTAGMPRREHEKMTEAGQVWVIDTATDQVADKIPVGSVPIQVYATPDNQLLFVANQGSKKAPGRTVSVIDLARLEVVKTIETGPGAHGVVVTTDGRYAFVTNTYGNTVSVIDVGGLEVAATVPVGKGPNGVSVTP